MKSKNWRTMINPCTPPHGITKFHLLLLLLFLSHPFHDHLAAAQPSDSISSDDDTFNARNVSSSMAVIVIVLVVAFLITGCVSIYIQQCADSSPSAGDPFVVSGEARSRGNINRGLDRSVIEAFPTFLYSEIKELKIGKGSLECAVCLSEFENDESLRLLPKCDHVFHSDCIDAWLVGHSTCPVCRANLVPDPAESIHRVDSNSAPEFPSSTELTQISIDGSEEIPKRKFLRSHSTGHSLIQPGEDSERFTLRLPAEVRRQLVARAKLKRATSFVALGRASSSRRGYRSGGGGGREGSGSSRYGGTRDRWPFAPFGLRVGSFRSMAKVGANGDLTAESMGSKAPLQSLPPLPV